MKVKCSNCKTISIIDATQFDVAPVIIECNNCHKKLRFTLPEKRPAHGQKGDKEAAIGLLLSKDDPLPHLGYSSWPTLLNIMSLMVLAFSFFLPWLRNWDGYWFLTDPPDVFSLY